jgi:hypothetical protein
MVTYLKMLATSGAVALVACMAAGCAGSPVAPFDSFRTAPVTVYRLQNWEPPTQATTPGPVIGGGIIPGIPVEIDNMIKAGTSIPPPGLIPPGLLPGTTTAATPAVDTQRFHGFRIIGTPANVMDDRIRRELIDIFGIERNFDNTHANCVYAEFGVSFARVGLPPADILVSVSCDQVQAYNFIWPHRNAGLTQESRDRFVHVVQNLYGLGG